MFEFDNFYADYYDRHQQAPAAPQDWQAATVPSPDRVPFLPSPDCRRFPVFPTEEDELLGNFYSESDGEKSSSNTDDDSSSIAECSLKNVYSEESTGIQH